jgi:hypothetical protein
MPPFASIQLSASSFSYKIYDEGDYMSIKMSSQYTAGTYNMVVGNQETNQLMIHCFKMMFFIRQPKQMSE